MQRVLSTHLLVNHRLTSVWLDRIWNAGIPSVEIFCARQHFDYQNRAQVMELSHWFRDAPLQLHALHSPMFNDEANGRSGPDSVLDITALQRARRIQVVDEIKRALEVAELIPCKYLIQHMGVTYQEFDEHRSEAAFTSLEEILLFARNRGVEVLLENIRNEFSTADRLNWFNNQTHLNLNYCFDIGHANLMEGVEAAFEAMRPRIRSTHIHDNNREDDQHLFPAANGAGGTIDWRRAMTLLRSAPGQFPLLLELKEPAGGLPQPVDEARRTFETLENLREDRDS